MVGWGEEEVGTGVEEGGGGRKPPTRVAIGRVVGRAVRRALGRGRGQENRRRVKFRNI